MAAPIIAPSTVTGLRSNQTKQFTADQAVTWSCNAGSISSGGLFTPVANLTRDYAITATNGSSQATSVSFSVIGVFDWDIARPIADKFRKEFRVFNSRAGTRETRIDRQKIQTIEIRSSFYSAEEREAILSFWDAHHPHKDFYFYDKDKSELWLAWITGEVGRERNFVSGSYIFTIERIGTSSISVEQIDPSIPTPPIYGSSTSSSITWTGDAATDNVGVTGYEIEIDRI